MEGGPPDANFATLPLTPSLDTKTDPKIILREIPDIHTNTVEATAQSVMADNTREPAPTPSPARAPPSIAAPLPFFPPPLYHERALVLTNMIYGNLPDESGDSAEGEDDDEDEDEVMSTISDELLDNEPAYNRQKDMWDGETPEIPIDSTTSHYQQP
ncbi:hypothetical protein HD806DRAFT_317706 [Xylariaceae sp. AK1471]|nr:hypothetical protein HD806DRAFT_317706 [Xylariaceae sp. AK1471]